MRFHKHAPIIKIRNLSGITSLQERALLQRRRYFTRIQAYGNQHYVYQKFFHNTPSMISVSSSWNLFVKEFPEWSSQWMDTSPFVDSPPWEMAHIECHMSMLKKNKSCYSAKEVEIIFKNYVNIHFANYMLVYTDGSVKDCKAGAAACIPDLNLNIFAPLPINSSVLSAELFAVRLALDALSDLGTSSRNVLFLSDSLSSIHLLNKINYQADDYDRKNIRQKIGYLFSMGCGTAFLHIPSYKEIKYNEMADNLANKAVEIPPTRNLRTKKIQRCC